MANRTGSGVACSILEATRQLAAAASDGEFDAALSARERHVRALRRVDAAEAEDLRQALALGEQVRVALLRSMVEDRAALERLRAMTPACHAQSSVACTG